MNNEIVTSLWAEKNVMGNSTSSYKSLMKLLAGLATKKIWRYNNSPPYVTARWPPQQIPPLNFLGWYTTTHDRSDYSVCENEILQTFFFFFFFFFLRDHLHHSEARLTRLLMLLFPSILSSWTVSPTWRYPFSELFLRTSALWHYELLAFWNASFLSLNFPFL